MKKYIVIIFAIFTAFSAAATNPYTLPTDSSASANDTTSEKCKTLTITPLQLVYGELLMGFEKQKNKNVFNIYRLGLIYSYGDFYGIHMEYGKKYFIGYHFYRSIVFIAKYEYDNYEAELDDSGFFSNPHLILKDNKYVFGIKILYGIQTSCKHKIISDFYAGFGLRLHYYQNSLNFEMPNPANSIIVPSVHLGITLMYNLKK